MTRARGFLVAAAVAAGAMGGLAACQASRSGRRDAPLLGPDPSPPWAAGQAVAGPPTAAPAAIEPGFTPCCGSGRYRIEIACGEMLKRCYENRDGVWRQTYGRHCRAELGESCYLEDCDAKCQ